LTAEVPENQAVTHGPAAVSDFLDPEDPTLFPRLTATDREQIGSRADRISLTEGEVLFEQGQRDTPFYVVEIGAVDILDRRPEGDRHFTQCRPGTFIGDIAVFTGEPTIAAGVAAASTSLLSISAEALRDLVARCPDLGDLILRTMVARREWLQGHGYGHQRLIGSRWSSDAFAVRELLQRNLVPFTWHDLETDDESRTLLGGLGIDPGECPVLVCSDSVTRRATVEDIAAQLGLRAQIDGETFDVVVLGGGPAGLATAVYAASEGLTTVVLERFAPGGQAGTSSRIENYLGFPTGLSGAELTSRATLQARKFGAVISSAHESTHISETDPAGRRTVELADGQKVAGRSIVLAWGADYRRLEADDAERFEGLGLYYAATHVEALQTSGEEVVVVGGGNSAGQAVVNLSGYARRVHMVVRRPLELTMSQYLINRIKAAPNVVVWDGYEVQSLHGDEELEAVTVFGSECSRRLETTAVFAMLGASPRTDRVAGFVGLDENGFVVTGQDAARHQDFPKHWDSIERDPLLLETTRHDVFAVGDVRCGSTKRVASAVGDGALVVRSIHESFGLRAGR
jgi:thioredoxin reductase (NADPH)